MKSRILLSSYLTIFFLLAASVFAWDPEDHEIFDLVSALETAEGKGTTFYTLLGVSKSASLEEIKKASRKLSLSFHPDKHPGDKKIEAKFTRIGLVSAILKDEEKRKRYNFFHDNGVPRWKGTGYMYSRWQPGLGFAISFVLFVASLMQYAAQHVNYHTEIKRIQRFRTAAKQAAYRKGEKIVDGKRIVERKKVKISTSPSLGNDAEDESSIPTPKSRQERRRMQQASGSSKATGNNKSTRLGWIDMVVEGDNVWIVEEDGLEFPLLESAASKPSFKKTFIPALINRLFGGFFLPQTTTTTPELVQVLDPTPSDHQGVEEDADISPGSLTPGNTTKTSQAKSRKGVKPKKN